MEPYEDDFRKQKLFAKLCRKTINPIRDDKYYRGHAYKSSANCMNMAFQPRLPLF